MTGNTSDLPPGPEVRGLLRRAVTAALGTVMDDGSPYVSLVEVATDACGAPLLLLSDLAQHTRNLKANPAASLLVGENGGGETALAGARASLLGTMVQTDDPAARARYLARHPHALQYDAMADFHFYRFEPARAHLVAGFGRINWMDQDDLLLPEEAVAELAAAESGIVGHMNEDHADAILLYATVLLGEPAAQWRMTGIDPEGFDIADAHRQVPGHRRLTFESPLKNAGEARSALVSLVHKARAAAS